MWEMMKQIASEPFLWQLLIGQLLATMVAVALMYLGEHFQTRREHKSAQDREKQEQRLIANALHAELTTFWDTYSKTGGKRLMEARTYNDVGIMEITANYFAVFDGNTSKIGLLKNEHASLVIAAYLTAKSFFDSLRNMNPLLEELLDLHKASMQESVDPRILVKLESGKRQVEIYLKVLQDDYPLVENRQKEAAKALNEYLS